MALLLVTYQNLDGGTVSPQILFSPRVERLVSFEESNLHSVQKTSVCNQQHKDVTGFLSGYVSVSGSDYICVSGYVSDYVSVCLWLCLSQSIP